MTKEVKRCESFLYLLGVENWIYFNGVTETVTYGFSNK